MHVAGVRFTTLFILTHIKRFFIVFQTNYWTDVFVVRLLAHRGRWYSRTVELDQAGVDRLGDLGGVG